MRNYISIKCKNTECPLYHQNNFVPCEVIIHHDGPTDILFVGEAPGQEEAAQNKPFVGRSGQLLRSLIADHLQHINFAVDNVVHCNPLRGNINRPPTLEEQGNCIHFLLEHIDQLQPKAIVTLGNVPTQALIPGADKITAEHGKVYTIPIMGKKYKIYPTFHPSYALREKAGLLPVMKRDIERALGHKDKKQKTFVGRYEILKTVDQVKELVDLILNKLTPDDHVALDYETTSVNRFGPNKIVTVQLSVDGRMGFVIPLYHNESPFTGGEYDKVLEEVKRLFTAPANFGYWVAHHAKFEQSVTYSQLGILINNRPVMDTMLGAYILDENRLSLGDKGGGIFGLQSIVQDWLGFQGYAESGAKEKRDTPMNTWPMEELAEYGAMDAYITHQLFTKELEMAKLQDYEEQFINLLEHLYHPSSLFFTIMEYNGQSVDVPKLRNLASKDSTFTKRMDEIARQELPQLEEVKVANKRLVNVKHGNMMPLFGDPWLWDLNKPEHKKILCIDVLQLQPLKRSKKTEKPSLDAGFFEFHKDASDAMKLITEYNGIKKLLTSFITPILRYIGPVEDGGLADSQDGRVRPSFFLHSTVSGRSSCRNPNLQQIPRGDNEMKLAVKDIFRASEGNVLIQLDYMASEVRWWALCSKDKKLADAFNLGKAARDAYRKAAVGYDYTLIVLAQVLKDAGKKQLKAIKAKNPDQFAEAVSLYRDDEKFRDIVALKQRAGLEGDVHKQTASLMYGVPIEEVTKEMRQSTKTIVFGAMYGRGEKSIAAQLGISVNEAQKKTYQFFEQYKKAEKWLYKMENFAEKHHYVESPIGRRRRFYEFMADDWQWIGSAKRRARNSPIQGISWDASMMASAFIALELRERGLEREWKIVNSVHDSLIMDVPKSREVITECLAICEEAFTTKTMNHFSKVWGVDFVCPLEVESEIGDPWGQLKGWDFSPAHLESLFVKLKI